MKSVMKMTADEPAVGWEDWRKREPIVTIRIVTVYSDVISTLPVLHPAMLDSPVYGLWFSDIRKVVCGVMFVGAAQIASRVRTTSRAVFSSNRTLWRNYLCGNWFVCITTSLCVFLPSPDSRNNLADFREVLCYAMWVHPNFKLLIPHLKTDINMTAMLASERY